MELTNEFIDGLNIDPVHASLLKSLLTERSMEDKVKENAELTNKHQKDAYYYRFKGDMRRAALNEAHYLKPTEYDPNTNTWDILVEAERIYLWLIDVK